MTSDRVDADVHVEAPQVATLEPYLSAHWRDYLRDNGFQRPAAVGLTYPPKSAVMEGAPAQTSLDEIQRQVLSRCRYAVLNCYYGAESVRHPFLAGALASAVNDWIADEFLTKERRLVAGIVVTPQDTALAVEQIGRAAHERRFTHVFLPARGWEPYGNRRYWPIYEAALERDLAVTIHFGGYTGNPPTPVGQLETYFEEYASATQIFGAHLMSLMAEGVFDRYPELRVGLIETGVTWLPAWLWRLDTQWKATRREIPWVRRLPSSYIRERVRLTAQPLDAPESREDLLQILEHLGSDDMLMYASDHPHRHASDPDALVSVLGDAQREKLLRTNAWTFYGLEARTHDRVMA